jgi:hypothetical protein
MDRKDETNRIRRILLDHWDPIGLSGVMPDDEYDSYIPAIIEASRRPDAFERLWDFLAAIEKDVSSVDEKKRRKAISLILARRAS